jgi:hypothetical protein
MEFPRSGLSQYRRHTGCGHGSSRDTRDVEQILPRPHDVQIVIGTDMEQVQHLVEHLAVLGGDADQALKPAGMSFQLLDDRRHLDRLGAGTEYGDDLFHDRYDLISLIITTGLLSLKSILQFPF